jgi:hypothetical protein
MNEITSIINAIADTDPENFDRLDDLARQLLTAVAGERLSRSTP